MKSLIDRYVFSIKISDCKPSPLVMEGDLFTLDFYLIHIDNPDKSLCSRTVNIKWTDLERTAEQFNGVLPVNFSEFPLISFKTFVRLAEEELKIPVAIKGWGKYA